MKVVAAVAETAEWSWLQAIGAGPPALEVVPLSMAASPLPGVPGLAISCASVAGAPALTLPSFAEILQAVHAERPEACLVLSEAPGARLLTVAADLLGIAVFTLVTSQAQLRTLAERAKARPDLFLLADRALLPGALADARYGSTMLPTGHPGAEGEFGGQSAARRIAEAIQRWQAGTLEPARPDVSVIVPAFREAANLPMVCERLLAALEPAPFSSEILLVDDASPDDTYQVALAQMWRSPRIRALTKAPPRGMGNAIQEGLARARGQVVAITMADGSDEVARIPEMVAAVRERGNGLAIGSRYRHRANFQTVPRLYRFWSACFRLCTWLALGLRLSDYTNAFRVFDRRIFARYPPESGGFEISPEITFKAWFATRRVTEVDVRHLKRAAGQSSFSFLRAGPGYGKILIKALVNRWTGRWFTLDW